MTYENITKISDIETDSIIGQLSFLIDYRKYICQEMIDTTIYDEDLNILYDFIVNEIKILLNI